MSIGEILLSHFYNVQYLFRTFIDMSVTWSFRSYLPQSVRMYKLLNLQIPLNNFFIYLYHFSDFCNENMIFNADDRKQGTARRHLCNRLSDNVNIYTLEVSMNGYYIKVNYRGTELIVYKFILPCFTTLRGPIL